ncbi:MAG: hypothetical protein U0S12_14090 [Fimbriimonadales bacterium]
MLFGWTAAGSVDAPAADGAFRHPVLLRQPPMKVNIPIGLYLLFVIWNPPKSDALLGVHAPPAGERGAELAPSWSSPPPARPPLKIVAKISGIWTSWGLLCSFCRAATCRKAAWLISCAKTPATSSSRFRQT